MGKFTVKLEGVASTSIVNKGHPADYYVSLSPSGWPKYSRGSEAGERIKFLCRRFGSADAGSIRVIVTDTLQTNNLIIKHLFKKPAPSTVYPERSTESLMALALDEAGCAQVSAALAHYHIPLADFQGVEALQAKLTDDKGNIDVQKFFAHLDDVQVWKDSNHAIFDSARFFMKAKGAEWVRQKTVANH